MNGMLVVPNTVFNNSSLTISDQGLNSTVPTLVQSSTIDYNSIEMIGQSVHGAESNICVTLNIIKSSI